jgi:hypothetical protein
VRFNIFAKGSFGQQWRGFSEITSRKSRAANGTRIGGFRICIGLRPCTVRHAEQKPADQRYRPQQHAHAAPSF